MRSREERVLTAEAKLCGGEGLMINEVTDESGLTKCTEFGESTSA